MNTVNIFRLCAFLCKSAHLMTGLSVCLGWDRPGDTHRTHLTWCNRYEQPIEPCGSPTAALSLTLNEWSNQRHHAAIPHFNKPTIPPTWNQEARLRRRIWRHSHANLWPPGGENLPAPYMAKRWQLRPLKKSAHMAPCPTSLHRPLFMETLRNEIEICCTRFQFKSRIVNRTSP